MSHDADFAFMEGKGEFCTIHGEDFAFKEKKNCFLHKSEEKYCIYSGKRGILYEKTRARGLYLVETRKEIGKLLKHKQKE